MHPIDAFGRSAALLGVGIAGMHAAIHAATTHLNRRRARRAHNAELTECWAEIDGMKRAR